MAKGWNCVRHIDLHMLICLEHILSNMHTEANVKDLNLKEPLALKLKTGALPANRPLLFIPESEGRPMLCFTASDCLNRCRVQTPGYHKDKGKRSGLRANGFCKEQRLCVFLLLAGGGQRPPNFSTAAPASEIYSGSWHGDINHWGTFFLSQKTYQQKHGAGLNQKHRSWESSPDFKHCCSGGGDAKKEGIEKL